MSSGSPDLRSVVRPERELHPLESRPFAHLLRARRAQSRRASSWDRTGGNRDYLTVEPGQTVTLLETEGPGCVTHTYCALAFPDLADFRNAILRCYWDGSDAPSVEVPMGDFFGVAHARVRELASVFVAVNPGFGSSHGLNAYFPMPFEDGARVTLEHRGEAALGGPLQAFWYHIDYELYDHPLPEGALRFHARFSRERRTVPVGASPNETHHPGLNLDGTENYVALDTIGRGSMAGLLLEIDNVGGGWYGEGDDMVFVDGEEWPPSIHGTGTEEIFGGGACPSTEYTGPYTGFHLVESSSFEGLVAMYRWFANDPIVFQRSLRWSVEHGHANNFANDYASVAYWYQEPVVAAPPLPPPDELRPAFGDGYEEARELLFSSASKAREARRYEDFRRIAHAGREFYAGRWDQALRDLSEVIKELG
jgi:hypothetical protein